jgi:regulator of RNase E activity RraA
MELISPERIRELTSKWEGDRFDDGRPKVSDDILTRMEKVTTEEAWGVCAGADHHLQFDGDWVNLHPERVLVGRTVTCRYVPHRADLNEVIQAEGEAHGRVGGQNSWVIDTLVDGDVLVVELFGKIVKGTFIGDNLGTAIAANTGNRGVVIDGSIRDTQRVRQLDMNVLCKGLHPTAIGEVTMVDINGPVRIGQACALPGDVILATSSGVIFVPAHLAELVVERSEDTRARDYWGKMSIREGRYTPGEVDRKWSDPMEAEFAQWVKTIRLDELDV